MKAAVYSRYGPPEVVSVQVTDKPVPGENEILIRVHASTVNRTDCGFRSANYFIVRFFSGLLRPKNQVLGCEFSGEVAEVGKSVRSFKPGDKVFGFNDIRFGSHAEYLQVKETDAVTIMPENISYYEAAAISEGAHYALCDLRAAKVTKGQEVLVNGATGAIGSAAVQLLVYFGARVTAVCEGKYKKLVSGLGAEEVIDYTAEDFTACGKTFDLVFDAVGKSSFGKCKPLLKKRGIYISTELGYMSQNPFLAIFTPVFGGKQVLFPLPSISRADVDFLKDLVAKGSFKPVIDRYYTLEEITEAYTYVETGMKIGNVVLKIT